jgi:hypothetical protein
MEPRREVRILTSFFDDLDRQLRSERGPNGEPSIADFQAFDLLHIVEVFATRFDDLPERFAGRSDYRELIATGHLVYAYVVVGQLSSDGAIELAEIEIDLTG